MVRWWCERWDPYPHSGLSLEDFEDNRGRGLWLWGEPGTGKTRTACIAANHLSDLGWASKFVTVANLYDLSLQVMRAREEDERERLESLYGSYDAGWDGWELAVLDDFGKEHKTAGRWVQDALDSLIRNRFNSGAPTIVTTNLAPDAIGGLYNDSLWDFAREAFWIVEVTGESFPRRDRLMEKGDIDNAMPPRIIVIFDGLIGEVPPNRERRVQLLRSVGRWKAVAESYDIDLHVRKQLHDMSWRRHWRIDVVLFDHEGVARAMERRFNRMNLAIANVYAISGPKELVERLPVMPEVIYVVHGNPEWTYAFGRLGHLGLMGL